MKFETTLGNLEWLKKHEDCIKNLFPDTWTHMNNLNALQLGYNFKLLGIDWESQDDFGRVMLFFEKINFIVRDGLTVKRNHHRVFN